MSTRSGSSHGSTLPDFRPDIEPRRATARPWMCGLNRLLVVASIAMAFVPSSACERASENEDGAAGSLLALGIDDGASLGEHTTAVATSDKETVLSLKTGAEVRIVEGAVSKDIEVTLARPPDEEALEYVESADKSWKLGSAPYVITPHKQEFARPVEVTLPIAPQVNSEKLQVVYLEDEKDRQWKVAGRPEIAAQRAKIKVDHFSVLLLVEVDGLPVVAGGADAGGEPSCQMPATAGDFVGTYIVKLAPLLFESEGVLFKLSIHSASTDGLRASLNLQSLTQAEPHVPVGPVTESTLTVEQGQFEVETLSYDVPPSANPLELELGLMFSLHGTACLPPSGELAGFCGTVDGMVVSPLAQSFEGDTYAALRSPDGDTLPSPVGSCADLEQMR